MLRIVCAAGTLGLTPVPAVAQLSPLPGSMAWERARDASSGTGRLASSGADISLRSLADGQDRFTVSGVAVRSTWNSSLPHSLNDGAYWAGRGLGSQISVALGARHKRLSLVFAPQLWYAQNDGYEVRPSSEPDKSPFASPWYSGRVSADLPSRFGNESIVAWDLGESALRFSFDDVAVGVSTETLWWGPGRESALVLSNNAGGIPHAFVEAPAIETSLGTVGGRLIMGALSESRFFDRSPENDTRAISGMVLTLDVGEADGFALGVARTVVSPVDGPGGIWGHALDAVTAWDRVPEDPAETPDTDQLISFFGQFQNPEGGLTAWAEWARLDPPTSLREMLEAPHHTQAWTLGVGWASDRRASDGFTDVVFEVSTVEQSTVLRHLPDPVDYYTGRATPQGMTQRGQALGAAAGPGSSTQFLGVRRVSPTRSIGFSLGRIRWANDALYRQPSANFFRHDVSLIASVSGDLALDAYLVGVRVTAGRRYNYLFQNGSANPGGLRTVDVENLTVQVDVTARGKLWGVR